MSCVVFSSDVLYFFSCVVFRMSSVVFCVHVVFCTYGPPPTQGLPRSFGGTRLGKMWNKTASEASGKALQSSSFRLA